MYNVEKGSQYLRNIVNTYGDTLAKLGQFLLVDCEQTYLNKKPFIFTLIWVRDRKVEEETIVIKEALEDPNILDEDEKNNVRNSTRSIMKIFKTVLVNDDETLCKKMNYRDFLSYVGKRCSNVGGSKKMKAIPMISHARDRDLHFMYLMDQYLPGEKFFKCDPSRSPTMCNDLWKNIPQVCSMQIFTDLCPVFYSDTRNLSDSDLKKPACLESIMKRVYGPGQYDYQAHTSDRDVEDLLHALLYARTVDVFDIPKMTFMTVKPNVYTNLGIGC